MWPPDAALVSGVSPRTWARSTTDDGRQSERRSLNGSTVLELNEDAIAAGFGKMNHEWQLACLEGRWVFEGVAVEESKVAVAKHDGVPVCTEVGFKTGYWRSALADGEDQSRFFPGPQRIWPGQSHLEVTCPRSI